MSAVTPILFVLNIRQKVRNFVNFKRLMKLDFGRTNLFRGRNSCRCAAWSW